MSNSSFTKIGVVTNVVPLAGSFCKATIKDNKGCMSTHVCGISNLEPGWPQEGEVIEVNGTVRNGKEFTDNWRR